MDIHNGGYIKGQTLPVCNTPLSLVTSIDPGHEHSDWTADYDVNGTHMMDGFCHSDPGTCAEYAYVPKSEVQPYFDIATNYGFANYFFQTNEGPSFPAHQFLFTGTSAPVAPGITKYLDFATENGGDTYSAGCPDAVHKPLLIFPTGTEQANADTLACYTHDSLVTDAVDCPGCDKGLAGGWGYYSPTAGYI